MVQHLAQHQCNARACQNVCAITGIEIENNPRWLVNLRSTMQEWMNLKICEVCQPDERRQIIDQNVTNVRLVRVAARDGKCSNPFRCKRRSIFFVEEFA